MMMRERRVCCACAYQVVSVMFNCTVLLSNPTNPFHLCLGQLPFADYHNPKRAARHAGKKEEFHISCYHLSSSMYSILSIVRLVEPSFYVVRL
ncbi:hypothetical protein BC832DRAFT_364336 [Gaertneriomyces semiglobifer]|nr:hypothetical protein BC832DRAFT_364336 [Gaertneriomyces semiglobifer]